MTPCEFCDGSGLLRGEEAKYIRYCPICHPRMRSFGKRIYNCFVVLNETDAQRAVDKARESLHAQFSRPIPHVQLFEEPIIVPAGWGYPDRVVVTFDPVVRDFPH